MSGIFHSSRARWRFWVVWCLLWVAPWTAQAAAGDTNLPFPRDVVIRGGVGTASAIVEVQAQHDGLPATLRLKVRVSEALNFERSTVTVLVDGVPVATRPLTLLSNEPVEIVLGSMIEGFHRLEFDARLHIPDDPCLLLNPEAAWLVIEQTTTIRWPHVEVDEAGRPRTLGQFAATVVGERLGIVPPDVLSPASVLAFIEAWSYGRQLGARPSYASTPAERSIVLTTLEQGPATPRDATELSEHSSARAIATSDEGQLRIVARTTDDLAPAMRSLRESSISAMCSEKRVCVLSDKMPASTRHDLEQTDSATVLSVAQLGFPKGWIARGSGHYRFEMQWQPPAFWALEEHARLQLDVRTGGATVGDSATIVVELNGEPLGSWELEGATSDVALVSKIPSHAFEQQVWSFAVHIDLTHDEQRQCSASAERGLWAVVGPTSALSVDHVEFDYGGIARFWYAARGKRPSLVWDPGLTWEQIEQLAVLVDPFARATPGDHWRWADTAGDLRIMPRAFPGAHAGSDVRDSGVADSARWLGSGPAAAMPMLLASTTPRLSWSDEDGTQTLSMFLPQRQDREDFASPAYGALIGAHAFFVDGTWSTVGIESDPAVRVQVREQTVEPPRSVESREAGTRRFANWLWGALGVVLVGGLVVYWIRTPVVATRVASDLENRRAEEE